MLLQRCTLQPSWQNENCCPIGSSLIYYYFNYSTLKLLNMSYLTDITVSKNYSENSTIEISHNDENELISVNGVSMEYQEFLDFANIINEFTLFISDKYRKTIENE